MLPVLAALLLAPLQPAALDGHWESVRLETAKGASDLATPLFELTIAGDRYTFASPEGSGNGKAVLDAKAGRLDLVGKEATLHCTYRVADGRLVLTAWPSAEARQKGGDALKAGAFVVTFEKMKQKLGAC